jgi:hypothetical protein
VVTHHGLLTQFLSQGVTVIWQKRKSLLVLHLSPICEAILRSLNVQGIAKIQRQSSKHNKLLEVCL